MKPSGVPWIGDIPVEWEIRRLKSVARIARGGSPRPIEDYLSDVGYNWIKISDATRCGKYITSTVQKIVPAGLSKTRLVHKGALLLTNSMSFGTPYIMGIDGCIHDGWVAIADLQDAEKEFLYFFLSSAACKGQFDAMVAGGVVQNLNVEKIGGCLLPLPPLPEQRAIAAFLDEKCATIDAIVEEAKSGIAEYAEWKRSIIFHAVTKGIPEKAPQPGGRPSPAAAARGDATGPGRAAVLGRRAARGDARPPMKDSGVEWIGRIPAHWHCTHVGRLFSDILGKMLANEPSDSSDTFEPYVCAKDVHFSGIDTSDLKRMWFSPDERELYKTRATDLLVVEGGAGAGGAAVVSDGGGYFIQNSIHLVRAKHPSASTSYLRYWIFAAVSQGYIDFICNKATIPHFTKEKLLSMPMPLPPLPEQRAIVAWLDEKCAAIDALVEEKKNLIEDLGAYKKSLIYETVTGKRRVGG